MTEDEKTAGKVRKVKSPPIYSVGQTVRINKDEMQFAKRYEQNWTHLKPLAIRVARALGREALETRFSRT
jgi:hypothetical protein